MRMRQIVAPLFDTASSSSCRRAGRRDGDKRLVGAECMELNRTVPRGMAVTAKEGGELPSTPLSCLQAAQYPHADECGVGKSKNKVRSSGKNARGNCIMRSS